MEKGILVPIKKKRKDRHKTEKGRREVTECFVSKKNS